MELRELDRRRFDPLTATAPRETLSCSFTTWEYLTTEAATLKLVARFKRFDNLRFLCCMIECYMVEFDEADVELSESSCCYGKRASCYFPIDVASRYDHF